MTTRVALLALAIALAGGAAAAQPAGQFGPGEGRQGRAPPRSPQDIARQLRARLALRPDQEGALQDFVRAMAPPPGMQTRLGEQRREAATLRTPERLDRMVSNMDEMRQFTFARVQATKAFYRQLTPDQQRTFDAMGSQSRRAGAGD